MEESYLTWLEQALQLCSDSSLGGSKLTQEKFNELAEQYRTFDENAKRQIFEVAENCLHGNTMYVYSCIFRYTGLQEFEEKMVSILLSGSYPVLQGCMLELQMKNDIPGHYREKRMLHRKNVDSLREAVGQDWTYIPAGQRDKNRVVIVTEQILSVLHAPTSAMFNIAYVLKKYLQYEVFVFSCPSDYHMTGTEWYMPVRMSSRSGAKGMRMDMEYLDEIIQGYQINMEAEDCIEQYGMMLATVQE